MKKNTILILSLTFVVLHSAQLFAQQPKPSNSDFVKKTKPETCELNNINIENAHRQAEEDALITGKSAVIILIGRPGKKDTKKVLTARRLYTARAYLTDYLEWRNKETVITAEAPNNGNEYGVIEIYITGQLYYVIASNPNFDVGFGSCDSPESDDKKSRVKRALLYPWLYNNKKK